MALVLYQGPPENPLAASAGIGGSKDGNAFVGLSNQGATCYLNGLLQTLFMTPEFRKAIFTWNYNPEKDGAEEFCIPLQLQRLFGLLQLSNERAVSTVALTHSFGWEGSEVFQQQDVQELTRVLFDALEETFKGTAVENIIDDLYAGELIDYLRCLDVDYQSERVDKFLDFSLAIVPFGSDKPMHSLTECIEMYLRPEILDGDNKYYAEKYDKKVDAIKGLKFGKLPQIMSVQLKRFVYDFSGPTIVQKKLNDVVKFPMILDMNKYVAGATAAGSTETSHAVNNEFEKFLVKQIDLLKAGRGGATADETLDNIHTAAATTDRNQNFNPFGIDDIDGPIGVPQVVHNIPIISEPPDYDDSFGTEAVSSVGVTIDDVTPIDAETIVVPPQDATEDSNTVVYESMSRAEVAALVAQRGEWVYELYAVLIHSGVINGGHYYAYIKDLGTQRWWNFNDSSVTSIDEKVVREAWGGSNNSSTMLHSSYYGARGQSCANAYMLMYRKVSKNLQDHPLDSAAHTESKAEDLLSQLPTITDEMVPLYIRQLVEEEKKKEEERRRIAEEERKKLKVKVFFNGSDHVVHTMRTVTYKEFLTQLWEKFDVRTHLGESLDRYLAQKKEVKGARDAIQENAPAGTADPEDVQIQLESLAAEPVSANSAPIGATGVTVINHPNIPCLDLVRLRNYNFYTRVKSDVFDLATCGDKTLDALNFNDFRTYILETRDGTEEWEEYFADGFSLVVVEYDVEQKGFKEGRSVRVRRDATIGDVRKLVARWVAYPLERIRLLKLTNCGHNDAQLDILFNDKTSLRDDLRVYDGYKLHVEEASADGTDDCKSYEAFLLARNLIDIRVNRPPGAAFDVTLKVDLRWTVDKLRAFVAKELGFENQDIRMYKQSLRGQELRDGPLTLSSNYIYNAINIAVSVGKAIPIGYFNILLVEYKPTTPHTTAVVLLPEPTETPEFEVVDLDEAAAVALLAQDLDDDSVPPLISVDSNAAINTTPRVSMYEKYDDPENPLDPELAAALELSAREAEQGASYQVVEQNDQTDAVSVASNEGVADWNEAKDLDTYSDFADFPSPSDSIPTLADAKAVTAEAVPTLGIVDDLSGSVLSSSSELLGPFSAPIKMADVSVQVAEAVPLEDVDLDTTRKVGALLSAAPEDTTDLAYVTPSDFGEKMVQNVIVPAQFENVEGLGGLFLQTVTPFNEVKAQIVTKLIELGRLPAGASPHCIRLRDKLGNNPGKILTGTGTFADHQIHLFDHKVLAFEVLGREEILPETEHGSVVVQVQRWHRSTWSLGERQEVFLNGAMSIRNIAQGLAQLTNIPLESLRAMVLPKDGELLLSDLCLDAPPLNYGRAWFDPAKESRALRAMSHEMRVLDGDVLLLQDSAEPLKELSLADKKSIEIVRLASQQPSYMDLWSASQGVPTGNASTFNKNPFDYSLPGVGASPAKLKRGHSSANGVHIKTHRDRLQEQSDRSLSSTAGAAIVSPGSSTPLTVTSGQVSPVLPGLEPLSNGIAHYQDEFDYNNNNMDDVEFQKQGGVTIFGDIN